MRHDRAPGDIEAALEALGVMVTRGDDDEITAFCPGHFKRLGREESSPSWSVNRETGFHNCFSCGFGGTFLDLVMELKFKNDVFRAARWLREFGVNLDRAQVVTYFDERAVVEEAPQTLVPETRLAMYADVPEWALKARSISREAVDHYGVRWDDKHESWIIPVRTPEGELAGWQEKWQKRRRFLNDPKDMLKSLCLFGLDVFPIGAPAVLLESPLDVCRLYTAGWEGGVSSYGAEVSAMQMKLILESTDEIVTALDNDKEGWRVTAELLSKWSGRFHVRVFNYGRSKAKDIGDMDDVLITYGLEHSQHSTVMKQKLEHAVGVHRQAQAVPGKTRRADGRPGARAADRRRGNRQDPDDGRGARGARRRVR